MQGLFSLRSGKGFEEFQEFEEFERVGSWEEQMLQVHVHRAAVIPHPWPGMTLTPTPPKGYPALCAGRGGLAAHGGLSLGFVGRGLDQSAWGRALASVARAMRRVAASTIWPFRAKDPWPARSASAFALRISRAQESSASSGVKTSLAIGT